MSSNSAISMCCSQPPGKSRWRFENARCRGEKRRSKAVGFLNNISRWPSPATIPAHAGSNCGRKSKRISASTISALVLLDYGPRKSRLRPKLGPRAPVGTRFRLGAGDSRARRAYRGTRVGAECGRGQLGGILQESRAVLCIPITYGEMLLGAANIESRNESAFSHKTFSSSTPCRPSGHCVAQRFVFPETAATIDHDGLTDIRRGASSGRRCRQSGSALRVRTSIFGGVDRLGQVQRGQRHSGSFEATWFWLASPPAGTESLASRTWWRATAATNSLCLCPKPAATRRKY